MGKVLGIIAEYNPIHNGHIYHIEQAKKETGADYTIAVITGNFTQRGDASIVDKWEKTKMALEAGVDLVLELPVVYSLSSAENFAEGAIKILDSLNIVDYISFGMESDNLALLNNVANVLYDETSAFQSLLKKELEKGLSFPDARERAVVKYLNDEKYRDILKGSNNILAIEYLKALKKYKSDIRPVGIVRNKVYYNSKKIVDEYASSTGIRHLIRERDFDEIAKVVPKSSFYYIINNMKKGTFVEGIEEYEKEIFYKLRTMTKDEISNIVGVEEGLENKIKTVSKRTNDLEEFIYLLKSKRYTRTRIQRILINILLGITKQDYEMSKKMTPYIRVLGCNRNGKKLISEFGKKLKVVTSVKRFEMDPLNFRYRRMLDIDRYATDIYTLEFKANSKTGLDYTNGMIVMED